MLEQIETLTEHIYYLTNCISILEDQLEYDTPIMEKHKEDFLSRIAGMKCQISDDERKLFSLTQHMQEHLGLVSQH